MNVKNSRCMLVAMWFLFILTFSGCAGSNLYSINMYYDAEHAVIPDYFNVEKPSSMMISVAEFNDNREIDDKIILGQVVESDGKKSLVVPRNIHADKAIPNGIRRYLRKSGFVVADKVEKWDLQEKTIPLGDSRIFIGGNIEELEISCRRNFPTNSYNSRVKLNVVFADMVKGRVLHRTMVQSTYSREHVLFTENVLGEQAEIVIGSAIEKLFEDKTVAQKIKEAMLR